MNTPDLPSSEQLLAVRRKLWHQDGVALLTTDSVRSWLERMGLVLLAPQPKHPASVPSLVEAVLGSATTAPTPAETEQAQTLLGTLIREGAAVPLSLFGASGETPDFVCSASTLAYVFTLRGDKSWKQPPATMGAVKVSPLGLAAYEALARGEPMSAAGLASEVGKEVTESAMLRALSELWAHLRVIPVPQSDGGTLWELLSRRFLKQMKAGANAGQPSALSALISLYLGAAVSSPEEEIETALSPLAPRSRIRDVVHALVGARQLQTVAIEGRTAVHLAGELPVFASSVAATEEAGEEIAVEVLESSAGAEMAEGGEMTGRITKFVPAPRKFGTGPGKFGTGPGKFGTGPGKKFAARPPAEERERRPFQKRPFDGGGVPPTEGRREYRPSGERPGAASRRPVDGTRSGSFAAAAGDARSAARDGSRPRFAGKDGGWKNGSGSRPASRSGPPSRGKSGPGEGRGAGSFGRDGGSPGSGERRPFQKPAKFAGARPEGRPFTGNGSGPERPRRVFEKPAPGERSVRPAREREGSGEGYTPTKRPGPRGDSAETGRASYGRNAAGGGDAGRGGGPRKPFGGARAGGFQERTASGFKKPGSPRPDGGFQGAAAGEGEPRKVYRKFDAPRGAGPRTGGPGTGRPSFRKAGAEGSRGPRPFAARSAAGTGPDGEGATGTRKPRPSAGDKPYRPSGPKKLGTFAKFAEGAKPFRKPGPGKDKRGAGGPGKNWAGAPRPDRERKPKDGETA